MPTNLYNSYVNGLAVKRINRRTSADLLGGNEGVAFDARKRVYFINDYTESLTAAGRPEDLLSVQRATVASSIGSDGLVKIYAANELRYEHDPLTLEPRGWLLEEPRENIFTNEPAGGISTYWGAVGAAIMVGASVDDPSGATSEVARVSGADSYANRIQKINPGVASVAGDEWAASCFVRAVTGEVDLTLRIDDESGNVADIVGTSIGTKWQRLKVVLGTASSLDRSIRLFDATGDFEVTFVQLEAGRTATSYIPTTTAGLVRDPDVVTLPVSTFPFNPSGFTVFVRGQQEVNAISGRRFIELSDNTADNRVLVRLANGKLRVIVDRDPDVPVDHTLSNDPVNGVDVMVAVSVGPQQVAIDSNYSGSYVNSDFSIPTNLSEVAIGAQYNGGNHMNGVIDQLMIIGRPLTISEISELVG